MKSLLKNAALMLFLMGMLVVPISSMALMKLNFNKDSPVLSATDTRNNTNSGDTINPTNLENLGQEVLETTQSTMQEEAVDR